jgi:predicted nuclease of predicted toxin-antitoxin system
LARFVTDENIPRSVTRQLIAMGHDVETTIEAVHPSASDNSVIRYSRQSHRFIVTLDKDFIALHRLVAEPFGVIVIRISPPTPSRVKDRMEQLLANVDMESHSNELIIVTETEITIEPSR